MPSCVSKMTNVHDWAVGGHDTRDDTILIIQYDDDDRKT